MPSGTSSADVHQLDVRQLLVKATATRLRVRARASLAGGSTIDLGGTPVGVELRRPDGTTLHRADVPAEALRTNRRRTSTRYARRRGMDLPSADGLDRLKVSVRRDRIAVSMRMTLPPADDGDLPERLTWVLHLGDACARDLALECLRTGTALDCESVEAAGATGG